MLWWWCMDYAMDGDLSKYSKQTLADAAGWRGDADVFATAMLSAGFLDADAKKLSIHDWLDFCGDIIHKRLRRKDEKRQKSADIVRQILPLSAKVPPTVPNRTVPNLTKDNTAPKSSFFDFESFWAKYPRRLGKKSALRHFTASVKTTEDWMDIQKALVNFTEHMRKENRAEEFILQGATWFNNWRDWVNYKGVSLPGIQKPAAQPRKPDPKPEDCVNASDITGLLKNLGNGKGLSK